MLLVGFSDFSARAWLAKAIELRRWRHFGRDSGKRSRHGRHAGDAQLHRLTGTVLLDDNKLETARTACSKQSASRKSNKRNLSNCAPRRTWPDCGASRDAGRSMRYLLAPVYGWFIEGFDTADLKEAKTLLGTTGVSRGLVNYD